MTRRLVWVSSWERACGIADYSKELFAAVRARAKGEAELELELVSLDEFPAHGSLSREIASRKPDLVHFQHEYAFFGGKNPPRYWFPALVREIRKQRPGARLMATAHTVIPAGYRFPLRGRGFQIPARWMANRFLLPALRSHWGPRTWGALDGVIVHSGLLVDTVRASGCPAVEEVPLFVPRRDPAGPGPRDLAAPGKRVLVFGFITPEKGQDIAVDALALLPAGIELVIAGGARRASDRGYEQAIRARVEKLGLGGRARLTGFVPAEKISEHYREADLVLAPFRETSGSASLTEALSRGAAVLASDLPLNQELSARAPGGALALFRSEDPADCARKIEELLERPEERARLSAAAREYAARYSPERIAEAHLGLYQRVLDSASGTKV